jgi:hypothetical protein
MGAAALSTFHPSGKKIGPGIHTLDPHTSLFPQTQRREISSLL